ncbi:uncharacterized protein DS421_5g143180 [Arachis hypogaea]|nr:uncharacterized protein DS421_5g143180 [Arachis hypogaea]
MKLEHKQEASFKPQKHQLGSIKPSHPGPQFDHFSFKDHPTSRKQAHKCQPIKATRSI